MSGNNWPDGARPGFPINPETEGYHWVKCGDEGRPFPAEWVRIRGRLDFEWSVDEYIEGDPDDFGANYQYLGPCLLTDGQQVLQLSLERDALKAERDELLGLCQRTLARLNEIIEKMRKDADEASKN